MKKTKKIVIGVCLLSTLSFFAGCVDIPEELTQFSIISFDVEPAIINQGEYANLTWSVLSASSVNIDNGIGNVALNGHRLIQPTQTTTYTLTASNATTTKNATATITVKTSQQIPQNQIITDGVNDVVSVDYLTQGTTIVTFHPEIDVDNLDIVKATYSQTGAKGTVTLQVRGSIENRGKIIDLYNQGSFGRQNFVEYDFSLFTTGKDYSISYSNQTGQVSNGIDTVNLTYSQFSVVGDTLSITFDLTSPTEAYDNMSVTSMFIKMNLAGEEPDLTNFVYLSDIAPNPPLEIMKVYAPVSGYVGSPIQFNGSIIPLTGQPPYIYNWDFGDNGTSIALNPTHVYTKPGHYTYTFTVTDQSGDIASKSGTITIKS